MADFNRKKLQVFVSSTFSDLIKERQAAVEAILTAGHIPAGMELFTAGDESQMEVIKQWIDESDVYLLILGGRYGSIESTTGRSYTQLEYEYALSKGKPLFACVVNDLAIDTRVRADGIRAMETEHPQKLKEFRATVLSKMCKFWDDTKDIKIAVAETLSHLARREELVGWIRANSQSDLPALANEIARLSKENAQLRSQLAGATQEDRINGLTFLELKSLLDRTALTDFFIEKSRVLAGDVGLMTNPGDERRKCWELATRGLIYADRLNAWLFHISDAGRAFLNKFESWQLASEYTPEFLGDNIQSENKAPSKRP